MDTNTNWPDDLPGVSTEEVANAAGVKPASIRERVSRTGDYFGLRPRRRPNGRLEWPPNHIELLRTYARERGSHV